MPKVFLYGPDTFRHRVIERVGACEVDGSGTLRGYELRFNKPNRKTPGEGLANITESEGQNTYGVVFDLSRRQIDTIEGYYGGYQRIDVKIVMKNQKTIDATTFIARRVEEGLAPSAASRDLTAQGAEENSLPRDFIDKIKALKPAK